MADQETPTEPELTGEACYCQGFSTDPDLIQCEGCKSWYHAGCLKAGRPSPLHGDVFFSLNCINCNLQGPEECKRKKLSWLHVIWLSLYNLQRSNSGKHGYFHWKHHISTFIQSNWTVLFGSARKKSNLWLGTVAGVLSSNSPEYFSSGAKEIGETGYWKLADRKPPPLTQGGSKRKRKSATTIPVCTTVQQEMHSTRPRRSGGSTLKAAMELKAKQSEIATSTKRRRKTEPAVNKKDNTDSSPIFCQTPAQPEISVPSCSEPADELSDFERTGTNPVPVSDITVKVETVIQEDMFIKREPLDEWIPMEHFESDDDLEVDPCALSPDTHGGPLIYDPLPSVDDLIAGLPSSASVEAEVSEDTAVPLEMCPMKEEPPEEPSISEEEEEDETVTASPQQQQQQQPHPAADDGDQESVSSSVESESSSSSDEDEVEDAEHEAQKRRRKMMGMRAEEDEENKPEPVRCVPLSLYEEKMLLKKIRMLANVAPPGDIRFNQLKRKLIVRQQKRDHSRKVFDLDAAVNKFMEDQGYLRQEMPNQMSSPSKMNRGQQVLDRYQTGVYAPGAGGQYVSFMTRLVGTEEDQLNSIVSPYTSRVLKPFIRRDYDCRPPKLKLLAEIRAYPHRNDPTWKPPPTAPIDYCYVRPQHIPSINALCREFFWPGIDLSECLQYPDFSCVVLYRKLVVGFAFMVPDVKYNEAYISFIFSRPEWQGAGMATFMLYHLIQTCMGKDVTLHVSATNPAMLLYQKFGFKPEEFILDFYDKYFPVESTECRHAFFLRLRR